MTGPEDNDFELPPEERGDGSDTLGAGDETVHSNLVKFFGETPNPAGHPPPSSTLGPGDDTLEANLVGSVDEATDPDGHPFFDRLGPGDITVNTNLAVPGGASTDAVQLPEGRFALGSKLGQGGMGEVFSARDSTLNREIAVKVLSGKEWVGLTRFVREAQVTAQLSHPNVVPVYGLEKTDNGSPALTMKLVRGDTFTEYIAQCSSAIGTPNYDHERHSQDGRIENFLRVCDAISYSHSRGVIHRDLKPDNLMIGAYGEVYVMDWGIARLQSEPVEAGEESLDEPLKKVDSGDITASNEGMKTRVGAILGTPQYMPPEQISGIGVGPKSDQFTLGMVLFEMLTFNHPRDLNSKVDFSEQVRLGDRVSFSDAKNSPLVPAALQAIVNRATSKEPADRYLSVEEFSDDLRRYVRGEEVHARPDNLIRASWRRVQRHPVAAMSALLIALSMAAAISMFSLYRGLEAERVASLRGKTLSNLVATVNQRVNEFDTLLFQMESLVEGIATSSREQLEHAQPEPYQIYLPTDLKGDNPPADLVELHRYQQLVSFDNFVVVLEPGVELDSIRNELFQLSGQKYVLRDAMLRSARIDVNELKKEEADKILIEGTPAHWAYLALENGAMLNYPANPEYPVGYHTRKRPWYVSAVSRKHGINWGIIYPDITGSGYLMPCNRPFYDNSGKLLGVAGLDLAMDTVIEQMNMPEVVGVKEAWLLDGQGRVVLSSAEKGIKTVVGLDDNKSKGRSVLGVSELEEHAKKGTTSGFVVDGPDVLVFARLQALPWTLVVRIDADSHGL